MEKPLTLKEQQDLIEELTMSPSEQKKLIKELTITKSELKVHKKFCLEHKVTIEKISGKKGYIRIIDAIDKQLRG